MSEIMVANGQKEVYRCEACGDGFSPDERMTFTTLDQDNLIAAAYKMLTAAQIQLSSAECVLAKLIEIRGAVREFMP